MQLPIDETPELEELEEFVINLRMRRLKLGFSQTDVGSALGKLFGKEVSQPTMSRFEALNLSYYNMCNLRSLLQKWLEETEYSLKHSSDLTGLYPFTTFKPIERRRTIISTSERANLTTAFQHNPRPTSEEFGHLAETLGMEKKVVRIWFSNRRQREGRINPPNEDMASSDESLHPPMHQPEMFAPHDMNQGPLSLSLPPPYSVSHLAIQMTNYVK